MAFQDKIEFEESIQNVFDEMTVDKCIVLRNSENVQGYMDIKEENRMAYSIMYYKDLDENISSSLRKDFGDPTGLGRNAPLYIGFSILDENKNLLGEINFIYYERINKLYVLGDKGELSWADVEKYRNYLLYDIVLESYLNARDSKFTMEDLGEFEMIDYLMPYEYCGMPEREADRIQTDEKAVSYIVWLDNGSMLCVQQEIQRDNIDMKGLVFTRLPSMVSDEVLGRETGSTRFLVQINGKDCMLSDLVEIESGFIEWMKYSGLAEGNLQRISLDRESGCRKTQQMLQNFPGDKMQMMLEYCEFYIEPGYLHIRFPYWDYEEEEADFLKNGNDLWRGWLTMRTDDIEEFLKVEKW